METIAKPVDISLYSAFNQNIQEELVTNAFRELHEELTSKAKEQGIPLDGTYKMRIWVRELPIDGTNFARKLVIEGCWVRSETPE